MSDYDNEYKTKRNKNQTVLKKIKPRKKIEPQHIHVPQVPLPRLHISSQKIRKSIPFNFSQ